MKLSSKYTICVKTTNLHDIYFRTKFCAFSSTTKQEKIILSWIKILSSINSIKALSTDYGEIFLSALSLRLVKHLDLKDFEKSKYYIDST